MDDIKKPKWDKPSSKATAGGFNPNKPMPPYDYIDVGMTAYAKHNSDQVIIKITKIENKYDAEGVIKNIIPKTKNRPRTDLAIGDHVSINRWDIEVLLR